MRIRLRGAAGVRVDGQPPDSKASCERKPPRNPAQHPDQQHPHVSTIADPAERPPPWTAHEHFVATISEQQRHEQQPERAEWGVVALRNSHAHEAGHHDQLKSTSALAQMEWLKRYILLDNPTHD